MKWSTLSSAFLVAVCGAPGGSPNVHLVTSNATLAATEDAASQAAGIGEKIPKIAFADGHTLEGLSGTKALVAVFLSFECPISTSYSATLAALAEMYGPRGVGFVGISAMDEGHDADVARQGLEFNLPFPVLQDRGQVAARGLRAKVTPEVFVFDDRHVLRYRGRIDDHYAARLKRNNRVKSEDLRNALEEVLASRAVTRSATQAIGCPITLSEAANSKYDREASSTRPAVTFYRDVLPILQDRCQSCHRPGDVGPFSLSTYRQAVNWAGDIKAVTQSRNMPPWKPVAGAKFIGARTLTERELETLAAWVDSGTPAGESKDAPEPKELSTGWQLGPPDLILSMPQEFELDASGTDVYRYFVLPTNLPKDRVVAAVEVRPGNRRVVHHAVMYVDREGRGSRLAEQQSASNSARADLSAGDRGPGYSLGNGFAFLPGFLPDGVLGGWSPGNIARRFPDGVGYFLPRGADVILQLHYHRTGRPEKDQSQVGLYFSRNSATRRITSVTVPAQFIFIPAGAARFRVQGSVTLAQDCRLYLVMPHMHQLGREIELSMARPGEAPQTLVAIKDWDYNWQESYFPEEPIELKAGTRLTVTGVFDNSAENPNNPNQPPQWVLHGVETNNEMCAGFLGVAADSPGPIRYDVHLEVPGVNSLRWRVPGLGF